MNYLEFIDLLKQDEQNDSDNRRFELMLDYNFKVFYDDDEDTYWYYNPQKEEVIEVEFVGNLRYKEGNEPYNGSWYFDNPLDYWGTFVESICCGVEKDGKDIIWFDIIHNDEK